MLANVALIEARDRAEDEERMRIRQEDAQKALQRALSGLSSSGEYTHREQERSKKQNDCADASTNAAASDIYEEKLGLQGKVNEVGSPGKLNSGVLVQANGTKIRPPAFLTPAKSQTTTPISSSVSTAPPDVSTPSTFEREDNAGGRRPKRDH